MPIVNSTATADAHTQADGSRYVVERHTDDTGRVHQIAPYLAAPGFDINARMTARANEINERLAEAEAAALLG